MRFTKSTTLVAVLAVVLLLSGMVLAQTMVTGAVNGTVTDPSGAVIISASVALTSASTGAVDKVKTNAAGFYSFPFVRPGDYKVTAGSTGFASVSQSVTVALGAAVMVNLKLSPAGAQEVVEVTGEAGAIQTEDANLVTNFNSKAIDLLPNPGNDLSAVALTAPGVIMNTTGGAAFGGGNFELYGLPATSNIFTLDGASNNDPYFNINNSGATDLQLGLNDIAESTVVANGYSGQYGGLAGANINYVSKSGSNAFHGNLIFWWNGSAVDANEYFLNQSGTPKPRVNADQYAGSLGGPIKKDKAFFFFDYEAIRLVIPSPVTINFPSYEPNAALGLTGPGNCPAPTCPAGGTFEETVLKNLAVSQPASVPLYKQIFNTFNSAAASGTAAGALSGGGCSNYTGLAAGVPCAFETHSSGSAHTNDYLASGKVDVILGNKDKLFVRVGHEHGLQASYTDPISPAFDAISDQPQWQGQMNETHTFGSDKVNSFLTSFTWYAAGFNFANAGAEQATLPFTLFFSDASLGVFSPSGIVGLNPEGFIFPQGRNITQYQFVDDFSWSRGKHTIKLGVSFRRSDITDYTYPFNGVLPANPTTPFVFANTLADFAAGGIAPGSVVGDGIGQTFPTTLKVPIALYQLGFYVDDEVKATSNLKLTLSLRGDHISNPVCQTNCFQRLTSNFELVDHDPAIPPNQAVLANQKTAFPSVTGLVWEPKIGFAWSPFGSKKTVVRGGAGIFVDAIPTGAIDAFLGAAPLSPGFLLFNAPLQTGAGSIFSVANQAGAAFAANFGNGGLTCGTAAVCPKGTVPQFSFYNATPVKPPRYYEWDLEVQREVGWRTTVSAKYVGNHGSFESMTNASANAFGLPNLPATVPDVRFGQVQQVGSVANSNYDGLTVSAQHAASGGLQFQASYTYSHALDEISNGGFSAFTAAGFLFPQDPTHISLYNYGNSDYDLRHSVNLNYVWSDAFRHLTHWGPNALMKGWNFSGTLFWHTGFPFTITSSGETNVAKNNNYGATIFASLTGPVNLNCGSSAALVGNPCFVGANIADPADLTYGDQRRNQFRGPGLFDTDFGLEKAFSLPKWEGASFSVGVRAFNLLNHPNFSNPVANFDSGLFGSIISSVAYPTGILGSGLGAANSPRLVQLQAKLVF